MEQQLITEPLRINAGLQKWYVNKLKALVIKMIKDVYKEIKPLYKANVEQITFAEDDSISSQARIKLNALKEKYRKMFGAEGENLAKKMIAKMNTFARVSFMSSIKKLLNQEDRTAFMLKGSAISPEKAEVIKSLVYENVSLITNIQEEYLNQITGAVMRSIQNGLSTSHIEEELLKYAGMTERRAKNIALDQTRKAYNAITLRNFQDIGVKRFKWLHVGGSQKPRTFHMMEFPQGLNHGIFELDNPPIIDKRTGERGFPGQLPYCRCNMCAVLDLGVS